MDETEAVIIKPMDPNPRESNDVFLLEEAAERGWSWSLAMRPEGVTGSIRKGALNRSAQGKVLRQVVDVLALYAIEQDTNTG